MPAELSGDVIVQLRDKALTGRGLYDAACALRARVGPRARVVVNGRADVARASGADGVHLPAAGLPIEAVRAWWPDALIGRSTQGSLQSGFFWGYVSLVDGIIDRMRGDLGEDSRIIATGGMAGFIHGESKWISTIDPNLTLRGLYLVARRLG